MSLLHSHSTVLETWISRLSFVVKIYIIAKTLVVVQELPPDITEANSHPKGGDKEVNWVRPFLSGISRTCNINGQPRIGQFYAMSNLGEGGLAGTNSFSSSSSTLPFSSWSKRVLMTNCQDKTTPFPSQAMPIKRKKAFTTHGHYTW